MGELAVMRLLVTGGAGFIGSNFVRHWLREHPKDEVLIFDLLTYAGSLENVADSSGTPGHQFVRGDIADPDDVHQAFASFRPDLIVNFAAESHNSRALLDPGRFLRTNALGTQVLLEEARHTGIQRFHHVSTCEVF